MKTEKVTYYVSDGCVEAIASGKLDVDPGFYRFMREPKELDYVSWKNKITIEIPVIEKEENATE